MKKENNDLSDTSRHVTTYFRHFYRISNEKL